MKHNYIFVLFIVIVSIFIGCSSPLTRLITTGNPSIPDAEIMDNGYYFVSTNYYGIFGPIKYYQNTSYGEIQGSYLKAVYSTYNLDLSSNLALVNGLYPSEEYANRERKNEIDNIIWHGNGNYREISY